MGSVAAKDVDPSEFGFTPQSAQPLAPKDVPWSEFTGTGRTSFNDDLVRQLGLTGRYMMEGISSIPTMVGDAANTAINLGSKGINKSTGSEIPMLQMPSSIVAEGLTNLGAPEPQGALEQIVGGASKSLASVPSFAAGAYMSGAKALSPLMQAFGTQARGAIGAGVGSSGAKELGLPLWAQIGAGLGLGAASGLTLSPNPEQTARAAAFREAGVPASVADVTQSKPLQVLQSNAGIVPFSGAGSIEANRVGAFKTAVDNVANSLGTPSEPVEAGQSIKDAVAKFINAKPVFGTINAALKPDEFYDAQTDALQTLKQNADTNFGAARAANPYFYAKDIPELNEVLSTPYGKSALNLAMTDAANLRQPFGLARASDGKIMKAEDFDKGDTIHALTFDAADAIRKSFNTVIQNAKNPLTGGSANQGRIAASVKNDFINTIGNADQTKGWLNAVKEYGDDASVVQALRDGREVLSMDPEEISQRLGESTPAEQEAFRTGAARAVQDKIKSSPDNADVAKSLFGNEATRDQMQAVFPNDKTFKAFQDNLSRVDSGVRSIFTARSPEEAYRQIESAAGPKGNVGKLESIKSSVAPEDWNNLVSSMVSRFGKPNPGSVPEAEAPPFSIDKFSTDYAKISAPARDVMFGQQTDSPLRAKLDNLSDVASYMKATKSLVNKSGTAHAGAVGGLAAEGGQALWHLVHGHPGIAIGLAGSLAAARAGIQGLYNPSVVNLMTKSISAPPVGALQQVTGQMANSAFKNPALAGGGQRFLDFLGQRQAAPAADTTESRKTGALQAPIQ